MQRNQFVIAGSVAALIAVGVLGLWWFGVGPFTPSAITLQEGDVVSSWDFQGSHKDDGPLEEQVRKEIKRLEGELGGDQSGANDTPTDYSLYVGIAGQYTLLGDGKSTYEYLNKALAIDQEKTGLAWHNMGVLMERIGAIKTAQVAYIRAVQAQPLDSYYTALLQFLMKYYSEDFATVDATFVEAEKVYGDSEPFLLQQKAGWLEYSGRLEEARAAWEKLLPLMAPEMRADIEKQMQRIDVRLDQMLEG
jgi:tetratricopeptide (TPR) repeat protein